MYKKELKNVLLDAKAIGRLITKAKNAVCKVQEALEEMEGINIMLAEYTHDTLNESK